jgi:hypothetical protein
MTKTVTTTVTKKPVPCPCCLKKGQPEYRKLIPGDVIQKTDEAYVGDVNPAAGFPIPETWTGVVYGTDMVDMRRKVLSAPEYYYLVPGDVIRATDEYCSYIGGKWDSCGYIKGLVRQKGDVQVRRKPSKTCKVCNDTGLTFEETTTTVVSTQGMASEFEKPLTIQFTWNPTERYPL